MKERVLQLGSVTTRATADHDIRPVQRLGVQGSCRSFCCFCCCSQIPSHNQGRGDRTGSSHPGAEEYPREETQTNQSSARKYHS